MPDIEFPIGLGNITYSYDYFCLAEGTPILVKDSLNRISLKRIEDIVLGDRVLSVNKEKGNQEWKEAVLSKRKAPSEILELRAKTSLAVTDQHIMIKPDFTEIKAGLLLKGDMLLGLSKLDLPEFRDNIDLVKESGIHPTSKIHIDDKTIAQIRKRGSKNYKICVEGHIPRNQILDYDFGLFVGLYLAKGSRSPQTSISFTLNVNESEISDFLYSFSDQRFGIKPKISILPQYGRRVVFLHRKIFADIWTSLFPGNCYSKSLPSWVFDANINFKRGLIHGWLFGDGTFSDRNLVGKTTSPLLGRGIHDLALSIGVKSTIQSCKTLQTITISEKDNISNLFQFPTFWKHDIEIRKYIDKETKYSKVVLEEKFIQFYKDGMTKKQFLDASKISEAPLLRLWGGWNKFLEAMGKSDQKRHYRGLSKNDLLEIATNWLAQNGNKFSVSSWDADSSVPSQEVIYKYFRTIEDFLAAVREYSPSPKKIPSFLISEKITKINRQSYDSEYVYDLTVKDNHNFLVGGIVTHNCGAQTLVFFEDILVDDIVRIGWSFQQHRKPIYGYASQYWNAVADGTLIGAGSFWTAYKEAAYIPAILRHISRRRDPTDPLFASPASSPLSGSRHHSGLAESSRVYEGNSYEGGARQAGRNQRANIERLMRTEAANPEDEDVQRQLERYAVNISAMSDREFENLAEAFEDAVWYGGNSLRDGRGDAMSPNYLGGEMTRGDFFAIRRADQFPPFDIIITFGDQNTPASNHSNQRLVETIIYNTQFGPIDETGDPIYVQYDFMFRNMM